MVFPILFSLLVQTAHTSPLSVAIRDAARRSNLDYRLVEAIVRVESNFKADAKSHKGAQGLMQVMPTFSDECEIHSAFSAIDNLMGACDCLRKLINRYRGNIKLALAAYNAGPRSVDRFHGIPPFAETKDYVDRVLRFYEATRS